jgi:sulfonate transport system substrate-binding protein
MRRSLLFVLSFFLFSLVMPRYGSAADRPGEIRLDYAYYSPESLVLKRFGWMEEEFKPEGIPIRWILSLGSNRALEFLNSGSVDFGSTAGLAAVLSRANGNPIKNVYIYSRPEWTALVVTKDSPIHSIRDLRGKKVASTTGTDPYLFLLRALHAEGMSKADIELVHLQHPDGRVALERKSVDAWSGLDPHMAASELDAGSRLLYRNVNFNTYGFLNTTETFGARYPEYTRRVVKVYEKARAWILANPDEAVKILSEEAKISPAVARLQLTRNDFSHPVPGPEQVKALKEAASILVDEQLVKKGTDLNKVIEDLIDPSFARAVIKG